LTIVHKAILECFFFIHELLGSFGLGFLLFAVLCLHLLSELEQLLLLFVFFFDLVLSANSPRVNKKLQRRCNLNFTLLVSQKLLFLLFLAASKFFFFDVFLLGWCFLILSELAINVNQEPPVIVFVLGFRFRSKVDSLAVFNKEEVKIFAPNHTSFFYAPYFFQLFFQLFFTFELECMHQFFVLGELFRQFLFQNIWFSFEMFVVFVRCQLNSVKNPF
jgi:hypothetical protein